MHCVHTVHPPWAATWEHGHIGGNIMHYLHTVDPPWAAIWEHGHIGGNYLHTVNTLWAETWEHGHIGGTQNLMTVLHTQSCQGLRIWKHGQLGGYSNLSWPLNVEIRTLCPGQLTNHDTLSRSHIWGITLHCPHYNSNDCTLKETCALIQPVPVQWGRPVSSYIQYLCNGVSYDRGRLLKLLNGLSQVHLHQALDQLQLRLVQHHVDGLQTALNAQVWNCMDMQAECQMVHACDWSPCQAAKLVMYRCKNYSGTTKCGYLV